MSATVRIKTKATDIKVIRRMAEQAGWGEVTETHGHAVFTLKPGQWSSWSTRISISLTTGEAAFDEDFRELREAAQRINQEYEAASVTLQADEQGYEWSRETNDEGFPVVYVEIPDSEMEVNYGG